MSGSALATTTLAGCATASPNGGAATPSPAGAAPTAAGGATPAAVRPQPKYGGAFRTAVNGEVPNLDPHQVIQNLYHGPGPGAAYSKLMMYRTDAKPGELLPTGDLAESWEQPDEATYIFRLRKNAKFHNVAPVNGRAVVAGDVKYSFERQIALKINASGLPKFDKIDLVDPQTLRLVSPQPNADFLTTLAGTWNKVVPHEAVDAKGDLKEGLVIGSGPWVFEKWDRPSGTSLTKNPDYYVAGYPRLDRLAFIRIDDTSTAYSAFRAKDLDALITGVTSQSAETLKKADPNIVLESFRSANGVMMIMNANRPPLNDVRVRQAIFKAIAKQQIIDAVYSGQGWLSAGVPMPRAEDYLPDDEIGVLYKQDLTATKQLLAAAGVPSDLDIELHVLNFGTTYKDTAELVQSDLAKAGLKSHIRLSDTNATWAASVYNEGSYDIGIGAFQVSTTSSDLVAGYHSQSATRNVGRVKDPALDAMIEKQATLVKDPDARKRLLQDIQRYLINSAQAVALVRDITPSLRWKYAQDYPYFLAATSREEAYPPIWLDK
jgi:peptide/nickel transport system substrate-binding protein